MRIDLSVCGSWNSAVLSFSLECLVFAEAVLLLVTPQSQVVSFRSRSSQLKAVAGI